MANDVLYGGKGPVKLVSTEWLQKHLHDSKLLIIDAQPNIHDYFQEPYFPARFNSTRDC